MVNGTSTWLSKQFFYQRYSKPSRGVGGKNAKAKSRFSASQCTCPCGGDGQGHRIHTYLCGDGVRSILSHRKMVLNPFTFLTHMNYGRIVCFNTTCGVAIGFPLSHPVANPPNPWNGRTLLPHLFTCMHPRVQSP